MNQAPVQLAGLGAFALLIMTLALAPSLSHPLGDKAEHILAFSVSTLLCLRSRTWLSNAALTLPVMLTSAVAIEVLQRAFSPTRWASLGDLSASITGIIAGYALAQLRGRALIIALAALLPFALAMNWAINTGRHDLLDLLRGP